jgi:D-alanyl-D-alanine dipeptidase
MDIKRLINRSKKSFEADPKKLICSNKENPLLAVKATSRLILDPIWEQPADDIEGQLYREYIETNPGYEGLQLRGEVAKRLYKASQNLPVHLKLVLRAGHRPLEVQRKELMLNMQKYLAHNKGATQQEALLHARIFIDDPAIKLPSHCCGAAVDVEVVDEKTNELLDFGCLINTTSEAAYLHVDILNDEQKNNRMILLTAMLKAGFAPTFVEWWHFSYGDTVWAYFYEEPKSLYGLIEPDL